MSEKGTEGLRRKVRTEKFRKWQCLVKRALDVFMSALGILVFSPVFLLIPLIMKATMPGPVFFKQERAGRHGIPFQILKFRSMRVDPQAESNHEFEKDKERITRFGYLMRRTKMDELPQLFNVLKGNMSLVGPRPTVREQAEQYTKRQKKRLTVRPGITGLAQVNGNIALSWEERIEYDLQYIREFSLLLDAEILLKTILVVLCGEEIFKKPGRRERE